MRTCTDATPQHHQAPGCGCLPPAGRRAVLGLLAAAGFARGASAGSGHYDAMLLNCIDPRFTTGSFLWMSSHGLRDRYSQFTIAGGPIGAVHPRFATWHAAFWDNLAVSVQLHAIRQVMAVTHRDCGAAKLAFGEAALATRAQETATHAEALAAFRAEATRRQPDLQVVTAVMDLDGTIQRIG
ncbi:hypothetical protein [Roseomonas sp. CECT 9278]|uniref:hypothetical protein n=1 Tax=Roseomonas sp. CECT 9278 TaxID=2845823 RepID=UPI001E4FA980|nr:hypothetical protein [Roseomonas sp. CECT 9278]CAH0291228.1 hypothetical protein ROS9278_04236 [Roseomonas sp. CECT 9278]